MIENFISGFTKALDGTEVPQLYSLWSGIAGVSALLGRRVYVQLGRLKLFPNLCIVLIAASGQKKSTPINALEDLLKQLPHELQPNLIPNEATPQHLVQAMTRANGTSLLAETSTGFGCFSELGTFLAKGAYDGALPSLLIDLIDCRTYDKGTIMRGVEKVPNPCFGFIGGTTIDYVRGAIPEGAIGGGLTSRFIFVHVEGRSAPVPFPPEISPELTASLLAEAVRLSQLSGQIVVSDDVYASHIVEYKRFYTKSPFWSNAHLLGYAQRRDKHLLKLAMIFALASGSSTIYLGHYEAALSLLYKSENIMQRMIQKITSTVEGSKTEMVLELISREDAISRSSLLRQVVHMMNSRELGEVLSSLRDTGQVQTVNNGRDTYYRVVKKES